MVVPGGTSGLTAEAEVPRIFFNNLRIQGSTMGTRQELALLAAFLTGQACARQSTPCSRSRTRGRALRSWPTARCAARWSSGPEPPDLG